MQQPDSRILEAALNLIEGGRSIKAEHGRKPFVLGICGAQGCGKSTLATAIVRACHDRGVKAATLSIDDLYLTRAAREKLAASVHPLLITRGVPGTHDIDLGLATLNAAATGGLVQLPRFDKARDDRLPQDQWPVAPTPLQVLIFEGWCVGAHAQPAEALVRPVNALEAAEDPGGIWRRYVNDALGQSYQTLFGRIDRLMLLAAPDFDIVYQWRAQQERQLPENLAMSAEALRRFIQHYERLTRHILSEMPERADCTIWLDCARSLAGIKQHASG